MTAPTVGTTDLTTLAGERVRVVEWADPTIERLGYDARSSYVERYWLPMLGPSTTWLVRHLAAGLERSPEGYDCDLHDVATSLGIGNRHGRHSPFARALDRAGRFGLLRLAEAPDVLPRPAQRAPADEPAGQRSATRAAAHPRGTRRSRARRRRVAPPTRSPAGAGAGRRGRTARSGQTPSPRARRIAAHGRRCIVLGPRPAPTSRACRPGGHSALM